MHIISVSCLGLFILYFLDDNLVQRTMVLTMKMVANAAREAMAMRLCFTKRRVEQCWESVLGGLFVMVWGDFVVCVGSVLESLGIKTPAGEVVLPVVLVVGGSVLDLLSDVEVEAVLSVGGDEGGAKVPVVDLSAVVGAVPEVVFSVNVALEEAEGEL